MELNQDTAKRLEDLKQTKVFAHMSQTQLINLCSFLQEVKIPARTVFIEEGAVADNLYILVSGNVEILKFDEARNQQLRIATLKPFDTIGELSLVDAQPRSASVRSLNDISLYEVPHEKIREMQASDLLLFNALTSAIASSLSRRLRYTNEVTVVTLAKQLALEKNRVAMGNFMVNILILICLYTYLLKASSALILRWPTDAIVSVIIGLFCAGFAIFIMRRNGLPFSVYGLNFKKWHRNIIEAIVFTVPAMLVVLLLKWVIINVDSTQTHFPLFYPIFSYDRDFTHLDPMARSGLICLYIVLVPLQELIVRGALQGSLQEFLVGKYRIWTAIIVSNLIYSMAHLYLSVWFSLMTFLPGLFWGWMYARQRSLVGVSVSHMILGIWTLYIVGIRGFM